jgi:DEAD/DEAH box helicase domain-containing protein
MQALAKEPGACALYLFPTKALAQDQRSALTALAAAAFAPEAAPPPVDVYDGDTPKPAREGIRARAQLLITNPDMLHVSMLPFHGAFRRCAGSSSWYISCSTNVITRMLGPGNRSVMTRA